MSGAPDPVLLAGAAVALLVFFLAVRALAAAARDRRSGTLVAVDLPGRPGRTLRSDRLGLVGRPDELRRDRNGALVPVEHKSGPAPRRGPHPSHRVQVEAYLLLVEETTGRAPAEGLLRYGDGTEWPVPWNAAARREVLDLLGSVRTRYDGRATPSVGKCRGCRWRDACPAAAA